MARTGGTENNPLVRPACFIKRIADKATDGTTVRLPPILLQPMAADDVARTVGRIAVGAPLNGTVEVAGPQQFRLDTLLRQDPLAGNDPPQVVVDPRARYFGAELGDRSLIPAGEAPTRRDPPLDWLGQVMRKMKADSLPHLVTMAARLGLRSVPPKH
jgi:hypothetical protein